jgi:alcohol dehydrogenase class IV
MVIIRITIFLFILLTGSTAHAGLGFNGLSEKIKYFEINDWSKASSSVEEKRVELVKKIAKLREQFDEAERVSKKGLSPEEIQAIEDKAIEVLTGAMVVCSSEVVN